MEFAIVQAVQFVFFVLFLGFFLKIDAIKAKITRAQLKPRAKAVLLEAIRGCRFSVEDWKLTIILPAVAGALLYLVLAWLLRLPPSPAAALPVIAVLVFISGIMAPVIEEFEYRAVLIGAGLPLAKYGFKLSGSHANIVLLLFSTLIFTLGHDLSSTNIIAEHALLGLSLGIIYLLSGRNLLPPVIAHAAFNLMVIFK